MEQSSSGETALAIAPAVAPTPTPVAAHERDIRWMFRAAGLPTSNRVIPLLAFGSIGVGAFSLLWNPDYYILQPVFWAAHIMVLTPAFLYVWRQRVDIYAVTGVSIKPLHRRITLGFYALFMAYWAYFCWLELEANRADPWPIQIANGFLCWVWYLFFAVSSAVYYYTATRLLERAAVLRGHVNSIGPATTKAAFFAVYDAEFEANRRMGNRWNIIIFLVILILTLNIPADLLGVLVHRLFVIIPGLIAKTAGLVWYLLCICKLNYMETYVLNYLHKHHMLQEDYEEITRYMAVRRLGLNFFGVRITYELLAKVGLLGFNVVLPTVYGLVANEIIHL